MSCVHAVFTDSCWVFQVTVFFEPLAEWSFGLSNVCVFWVGITCYLVDGPTLVFHRGFVLRVYESGAEGVCWFVVHVYSMGFVDPAKLF